MRTIAMLAALAIMAGCASRRTTVTVGAYTGDKITWKGNKPVKYEVKEEAGK